jgi:hypothetical protein
MELRGKRIEEFSVPELQALHEQLCDDISPYADEESDQPKLKELDAVSEELERRNERL